MYQKTRIIPIFILTLLFGFNLFAQVKKPSKIKYDNNLTAPLNQKSRSLTPQKKHNHFYLAYYSNNREFDNSTSVFSVLFNLGKVFSLPSGKGLFSSNYQSQTINFKQDFRALSNSTEDPNNFLEHTRSYRPTIHTESFLHYDNPMEVPASMPVFRNIFVRPSGFYMGYKF